MKIVELENQFKSLFDVEELKRDAKDSFQRLIENPDNYEIKDDIFNIIGNESYEPQYFGISIHILNNNIKNPFLRIRFDIINQKSKLSFAWYEVEYGSEGFQDEFFDFY